MSTTNANNEINLVNSFTLMSYLALSYLFLAVNKLRHAMWRRTSITGMGTTRLVAAI
jgi:hypothetical protein